MYKKFTLIHTHTQTHRLTKQNLLCNYSICGLVVRLDVGGWSSFDLAVFPPCKSFPLSKDLPNRKKTDIIAHNKSSFERLAKGNPLWNVTTIVYGRQDNMSVVLPHLLPMWVFENSASSKFTIYTTLSTILNANKKSMIKALIRDFIFSVAPMDEWMIFSVLWWHGTSPTCLDKTTPNVAAARLRDVKNKFFRGENKHET